MSQVVEEELLKKVWIVAAGSRGDIQPYVALGAALVKREYEVVFLTYGSYAKFAETFGMRGVAIGQDYESNILSIHEIQEGMAQGNVLRAFKGIAKMNHKNAPTLFKAILAEIEEHGVPDLCMAMPFSQYVAWYLYVRHRVPFLQVTTFAFAYNPNHMLLGLPKLPFNLTYFIMFHLIVGGAYNGFKAYEEVSDAGVLKVFTKSKFINYYKKPTLPMVTLLSPQFASVLYPPDVSPNWRFVGSTVLVSEAQMNNLDYFGTEKTTKEIDTFLKAGSKPVYLGWGSMICISTAHMVELCVRAVHRSGLRAIVVGGAAGLSLDEVSKDGTVEPEIMEYAKTNILFVEYAPHEWLFPRVAATVHHGGAGTTTAALRGGVPTIITPVFGDQFDFSFAVTELGVGIGFTKQFQQITWTELGDALHEVTSNSGMAKRAANLGRTLQTEDGANAAVDEMERYWKEYCVDGKFHEYCPCQEEDVRRSQLRTVMTAVSAAAVAAFATHLLYTTIKAKGR